MNTQTTLGIEPTEPTRAHATFARLVTREELIAQGIPPTVVEEYLEGADAISFYELARFDGIAAIRTLTEDEFASVRAELMTQGMPAEQEITPPLVLGTIWACAQGMCPSLGTGYDSSLHSAVACALFLRLVEDSLNRTDDSLKDFARTLGVKH